MNLRKVKMSILAYSVATPSLITLQWSSYWRLWPPCFSTSGEGEFIFSYTHSLFYSMGELLLMSMMTFFTIDMNYNRACIMSPTKLEGKRVTYVSTMK